jgi:hypothetical protein
MRTERKTPVMREATKGKMIRIRTKGDIPRAVRWPMTGRFIKFKRRWEY